MNVGIDLVVKFGGSAITDKNCFETLRKAQLDHAAECVRRCRNSGLTCLVVHGAGSFGHHHAKEYQVNSGLTSCHKKEEKDKKMMGYCLTRQSVTKLNQFVVNSLLEAGVPAIACSPGSSWQTQNRQPVRWPSETITEYIQKGMVPVFHGDCCLDTTMGCCILSGDTVIKTLCSFFFVKRVVFLTDVAGVYDRPPDLPGARLIKKVSVGLDGSIKSLISASQSDNDVTGGIMMKLKTAVDIAVESKGKCTVFICAVNSPDATDVCLATGNNEDRNNTTIVIEDTSP